MFSKSLLVILGIVGGGAAGWSIFAITAGSPAPAQREDLDSKIRSAALVFSPKGGLQGIVPRNEIRAVLQAVEPRWHITKANFLLHSLRLWGLEADFGEDPVNPYGTGTPSGRRMLELLLDSREAESARVEPYPFLYRTLDGVTVQAEVGGGGIAHHDQYLKVMGELGLPSSTPIRLPDGGRASLRDLIRNSLLSFDIEQELEFTAIAYSRWLPTPLTLFRR